MRTGKDAMARRWRGQHVQQHRRGWSLVEVIVSVPILLGAAVVGATALIQNAKLVRLNEERTMAIVAAQGLLEAETNLGFHGLLTKYGLSQTVPSATQALTPASSSLLNQLLTDPESRLNTSAQIRVRDVDGGLAGVNVIEIRVVVCWASRDGSRIIGEDHGAGQTTKALNGLLDPGEDRAPFNAILDAPAVVETRLARNS
jgi:type II secretory pathway pseudopilin PulG